MAKVAQGRRALAEVEQLREENADLKAQVAELQEQLAAKAPAKKTAPAKTAQ